LLRTRSARRTTPHGAPTSHTWLGSSRIATRTRSFTRRERHFEQATDDLIAAIPSLADHEVVVRMMQLVASIGDGHTTLSGTRSLVDPRVQQLFALLAPAHFALHISRAMASSTMRSMRSP
jgi:hypothetical protein